MVAIKFDKKKGMIPYHHGIVVVEVTLKLPNLLGTEGHPFNYHTSLLKMALKNK